MNVLFKIIFMIAMILSVILAIYSLVDFSWIAFIFFTIVSISSYIFYQAH